MKELKIMQAKDLPGKKKCATTVIAWKGDLSSALSAYYTVSRRISIAL
jgi:hypothetical protein